MARINDLKQRLLSVGGTAADWNMMLSHGLGLSDLFWNNGDKEKEKSQDLAREMMVKGNFVEYQCYQSNGALQGKAIIQLKAWENFDEGILTADHVVASDPYYEWYGSHDLSGGQAVYHVCRSKHTQCRCRLPRGDRREIVHMDRWRCVNPSVMLENGYSTAKAMEVLEKMVKDFQPRVPEPAAPPQAAPHGPPVGGDATGVDRALDQLGTGRGAEIPGRSGGDPQGEGKAKGFPRGTVGAVLMKRAEAQRQALVEKQRKDKDRGRSRSRRRKKDRDRRRRSTSSGMPRIIRYQETKEMRRRERQQIGRLQDQQVSQTTVQRYMNSMQDFVAFAGFSQAQLLLHPDVEALLSAYIERLWEDGDTKTMASYTVAAVQYFQPKLKGQLKQPWKLLSLWSKLEQPRRATPLSPDLLLAVAGQFIAWRWQDLGHLCVVGFCGFLRTGEMFQLRRSHVVLPRSSSQDAVLFIQDSKTAKRNFLQWEKVIISEQVGIRSLRALCAHRRPDDLLVDVTPQKFRDLWHQVIQALGLGSFHYLPYSLRRGGATSAYRNGATFEQLLEKGRWKHLATARLYLDQGLQEYASLTTPPAAHPFIRAAQQSFRSAG
eukprot:Skav222460  [mRNA]  locus=scaffold3319:167084:173482:+ [translate_table: standard]